MAAAGLLVFALSFDDFVITNFNAGQTITFPLFIWGAARQGVPPQVNVLATALLVIVLVFMILNLHHPVAPGPVPRSGAGRGRGRAGSGVIAPSRSGYTAPSFWWAALGGCRRRGRR